MFRRLHRKTLQRPLTLRITKNTLLQSNTHFAFTQVGLWNIGSARELRPTALVSRTRRRATRSTVSATPPPRPSGLRLPSPRNSRQFDIAGGRVHQALLVPERSGPRMDMQEQLLMGMYSGTTAVPDTWTVAPRPCVPPSRQRGRAAVGRSVLRFRSEKVSSVRSKRPRASPSLASCGDKLELLSAHSACFAASGSPDGR